ncbi:glycosyltransferase [Snuella sedimenti]|uniref:Glycosyltransferase n=1 Tax=Snuella sedimenti TaxID=2798802 RepID=A0A8J7LT27_9FLAO|nr:glycosyltransferase [Snuella sedimenti]MBJ6367821.1 glycosyltransferase [Snuella sedimenti]
MKKIVYVLEKFPSPTEYFILNEILQLEKRDIKLSILVIKKQNQFLEISRLNSLKSDIFYLPKIYLYIPFLSFFKRPVAFVKSIGLLFKGNNICWLKAFRDYCISIYFLAKLGKGQNNHFHAHFAFFATDIASMLSKMNMTNYSLTVHAQDIYTNESKLKKIITECDFLITCTDYNKKYLNEITCYKYEGKIHKIYHGIESAHWVNKHVSHFNKSKIKIVCVARLVEKKGLIYLLGAIDGLVKEGVSIECTIIGEGPLKETLIDYIKRHGLLEHVTLLDFQPQEVVKQILLESDIFVLPSIIAENGDRDGLPNVIVEAMLLGVPVISTAISAIPEMVEDRQTGLLVKDKDARAIAMAVQELIYDQNLYRTIAEKAKKKIKSELEIGHCTDNLVTVFQNNI